jgi:NAD(P)-dependent dehydrogenase (short-subunit alcohol dehydrogenase family)
MATYASILTQFFPPRDSAPLTEANVPSQAGRVFVVTGGSSGLGFELSRILYSAGGKVYLLTRTQKNAEEAIAKIKARYDGTAGARGSLEFIHMDQADLTSIHAAADEFLSKESRLDGLFNNAGTGALKNAPRTKQGNEYHFATNALGPFVLTRRLSQLLADTASKQPASSVRVIWAASLLVDTSSPKDGIRTEVLRGQDPKVHENELYSSSKTACWFLASEFAKRSASDGVVHLAVNPGNYITNIWRHTPVFLYYLLWPILRDPVQGAETYLWASLSEDVKVEDGVAGRYGIPVGRWHPGQRKDLVLALKNKEDGGSGKAIELFEWCLEREEDARSRL